MRNQPVVPTCSFCGEPRENVELLFVSDIGGCPPMICDGCATGYAELAGVHRRSPELAAEVIAAHNAKFPPLPRRVHEDEIEAGL